VNICRIKKSVAALTLTLAYLLGGFVLTLAHERAPTDGVFSAVLRQGLPSGIAPTYIRQICLEFAAGDVPPSLQKTLTVGRTFDEKPTAGAPSSIHRRPFAPKVARHMLDSVFLI
jgi:hypothetical protein